MYNQLSIANISNLASSFKTILFLAVTSSILKSRYESILNSQSLSSAMTSLDSSFFFSSKSNLSLFRYSSLSFLLLY